MPVNRAEEELPELKQQLRQLQRRIRRDLLERKRFIAAARQECVRSSLPSVLNFAAYDASAGVWSPNRHEPVREMAVLNV
jgi:hypothetical protein